MRVIYTIAFFVGLAIMGVELTAARLVAPYFGTSLFVWTNVIAVILAALSLGYYLGGRLSERSPHISTLLRILGGAGLCLAIIPFIVRPIALAVSFDTLSLWSAS
ncbi:MAG: fused MFS/spermidine synthase, partial [bacterium]|nr:fused MFS/spermidine synthase [bacterium]